jgi:hypothetical protein
MGTFASGDVSIYFEKEADAIKVHEILSDKEVSQKIEEIIGEEGKGGYSFYDFCDTGSTEICFNLSSDRVQNAEWQVDNVVKVLKKLTELKEIGPIEEFQAELLTQYTSWHMDASEFEEEDE